MFNYVNKTVIESYDLYITLNIQDMRFFKERYEILKRKNIE